MVPVPVEVLLKETVVAAQTGVLFPINEIVGSELMVSTFVAKQLPIV